MVHQSWSRVARKLYIYVFSTIFCSLYSVHAALNAPQECPSASWKKLAVVGDPTPEKDFEPQKWNTTETVQDYGKKTIAKKAGFSLALWVITLALLLIFLLWRCCRGMAVLWLCQHSCDEKRESNNPWMMLNSKMVLYLRIAMLVIGVTSAVISIWGMAGLNNSVIDRAWEVQDEFTTYGDGVLKQVDGLLGNAKNLEVVLDDLVLLVQNDVNVTGMKTNLNCTGRFLDALPDPTSVESNMNDLDTTIKGPLSAAIQGLSTALATLSANLTTLKPAVTEIGGAQDLLNDISSSLSTFNTHLGAIPASDPGVAATSVTDISSDITTLTPLLASTWPNKIDALKAALTTFSNFRADSPFPKVTSAINAINAQMTTIKNTKIPPLSSQISTINTEYTKANTCMAAIDTQLVIINTTVIQLDNSSQLAYNQLHTARSSLTSFYSRSPTPVQLVQTLQDLSNSLVPPPSTGTMQTNLANAESSLQTSPDPATFQTPLSGLKTAIQALSAQVAVLKVAMDAYKASQTFTTYSNLKTQASVTKAAVNAATTQTSTINMAGIDSKATALSATIAQVEPNSAAQVASVNSVQAQVDATPALSTYSSSISTMKASYNSMPTPKSQVTTQVAAQLDDMQRLAVDNSVNVKKDIGTMVKSFSNSTDNVRKNILDRLKSLKKDHKSDVDKYNALRYKLTMVLYALSIIFMIMLAIFIWRNCQFGMGMALFLLIVTLVFYFLIAIIMALALVVLRDGCYHAEHIAVQEVPTKLQPIAHYYLYKNGTNVQSVLAEAKLVNITQVLNQATDSKDKVIVQLKQKFTTRYKLDAILTRISVGVDAIKDAATSLVNEAEYDKIHPLYMTTKSLFCCDIGNTFGAMWTTLTTSGVLTLAVVILTFVYLGHIDKLPRVDCCGCTCHTIDMYPQPTDAGDFMVIGQKKNEKYDKQQPAGSSGIQHQESIVAYRPPGVTNDMQRQSPPAGFSIEPSK